MWACTPCKLDGTDLDTLLARLARSNATPADLEAIERRIGIVGYGARCYLATQQETVLTSILNGFRDEFHAHLNGDAPPTQPVLIAELLDIRNRRAILDEHHRRKQPDWSCRPPASGSTPVELMRRYLSAATVR